ncbi:hypothetical protein M422DRAFT_151101 [Sphaerobolus stellatus SS14]|nr:hypothetical protein M422DRAFT_151101 [Sphaerobolus stellatus SS14]
MELEDVPVHQDYQEELHDEEPLRQSQQSQHSNVSREPTFTDEGSGSGHSSSSSTNNRARTPFPNAFSSPLQPTNLNSTPTPAFQIKPRVKIMETPAQETPRPVADDLATPANRRHSFLLSLVNTSVRPRKQFQATPHPFGRIAPTPRPRAHPLSQAWSPNANSGSDSLSPGDHNSFISTASSHDLTVHPRANASFDPTMGAAHADRFNAVKLNTYLHSLNRRLQEENENLTQRLRMLGEEVEMDKMAEGLENEEDILEKSVLGEVGAMRDELEKRDAEKETMKAEHDALVQALRVEIDELREEVETEREGRKQDNEDWKGRLQERVERLSNGFEEEFKKLEDTIFVGEKKAKEAEKRAREFEQRCAAMEEDFELAKLRAEKAESALATSSDLGVEVKQAYDLLKVQKEETRTALDRAEELAHRLEETERRQETLRSSAEEQTAELEIELREALEAQQNAEAHSLELQQETQELHERLTEIETEFNVVVEEVEHLRAENADLNDQLTREQAAHAQLTEAHKQLEEALDEGERRMIEAEAELASVRSKTTRLEQELAAARELSRGSISMDQKSRNMSSGNGVTAAEFEQLEGELDEAHKEIGRLQHMLSQSPGRKAIEKAKEIRIDLLEKEKDDLVERVRSLTAILSASAPDKTSGGSPGSFSATPIPSRLLPAWKTPKTPGPPLKEFSWLNEGTFQLDTSPLVSRIEKLKYELNLANDSIDDKVNQLEEAGIGIVGLTERLEDARARTVTLEEEVSRLVRRDERRIRRLERIRCLECGVKIDVSRVVGGGADQSSLEVSTSSLPPNPRTPPSKKVETLSQALQTKTTELDALRSQWDTERRHLLGEKAVLQDATKRLNKELNATKSEAKRVLDDGRRELTKAKVIVTELEETLKTEQSRLRSLTSEQNRMIREKENIHTQLERAQSDMEDVRSQLESLKRNNRELEAELRMTTTVDQKARLLEIKLAENNETIEYLRGEREAQSANHTKLQRQFQEASAQVNRLRQELATSQGVHDAHRHQLDLRVTEIDDLRNELSAQGRELERVQLEKDQANAERSEIVRTIASLESDLKRVRRDAEALGKDLKELKTERDKAEAKYREDQFKSERVQKQLATQIRLANEQADIQRAKAKKAIADWQSHVCKQTGTSGPGVEAIQAKHKEECKGLLVQIKYLKAKFTRESIFRADLGYQKHYLLQLLSKFEKGEKQILAAIARLDFPLPQKQAERKRPNLRTIAVMVIFLSRAKRTSTAWREQTASKAAVAAALQDVRRRRVAGSLGYSA